MCRFGEAEELVGGTFFLADENLASFVNGVFYRLMVVLLPTPVFNKLI